MSNPIAEVSPVSLDELMDRDPLELTEGDIAEITKHLVKTFRAHRLVWEKEKDKAKITGKRVSGAVVKKKQKKEETIKNIKEKGAKIDLSSLLKK